MYASKATGGARYSYFSDDMLTSSVRRAALREELARAIAEGELALHYQPLVDPRTRQVCGVEALVRWMHPERGMISPAEFIPEAERSGLIVPLGTWVMRTAFQQVAAWQNNGRPDLSIAVNVSVRQLRDVDFFETVRTAIEDSGIAAETVEIELTESVAFENFELAKQVLDRLVELGVRIVIDDFGSGYSSLNRLRSLHVHTLKIDRSFIKDMVDDRSNAAIVTAVITMAHALGIEVVAEGIETAEQLAFLLALDHTTEAPPICDRVQGFYLARPQPAALAPPELRPSAAPKPSEVVQRISIAAG